MSQRVLLATLGLGLSGGIANLATSTLDALSTMHLRHTAWTPTVLTLTDPASVDGGRWTVPAHGSKAVFAARFARLGTRSATDLVIFDSLSSARTSQILPARWRAPYIVFAHGHELREPIRKAFEAPLVNASAIATVSNTSGQLLTAIGRRLTLPPVHVVTPCIERSRIDLWRADAGSVKREFGGILSVGRMSSTDPGKGHETLIQAMPAISKVCPSAQLVLVGDGDGRPQLEALAEKSTASSRIRFLSRLSVLELGREYQRASVFAMPSRQEGFGIVYAEAMWHGLPCVGSEADAAVDVIEHDSTGKLVPYGSPSALAGAVLDLLREPLVAAEMGKLGKRKCLREFTPAAFSDRLADVLHQCDGDPE